jgi:FRG domain-containing protein
MAKIPIHKSSNSGADKIWQDCEVSVKTLADFVREIDVLIPNSNTGEATYYWFRGQSNHEWDLEPSFLRITGRLGLTLKEAIDLELAAQREFRSNAHLYVNANLLDKVRTNPCWWAVMQHHGAPTRLLDWSTSPYVAAYFAAQQDGTGKDGAVWCFCSGQLRNTFQQKYKSAFPDFTKTDQEDTSVRKLHKRLHDPKAVSFVAPLTFPFVSSERIAKQQGTFTMCLRIHQKHNCISEQVGPEYVKRILIPHESKPGLLAQLRRMNITASAMFPGIDGLGRSVAELAALGAMYRSVCGLGAQD